MKKMNLNLTIFEVKDICFGEETAIDQGILMINKGELIQELSDPVFKKIDVSLARPGQSVRIIPVKDVIEPRMKANGASFPGILGDCQGCGDGVTNVLRGCAVVTTGAIVGFQEGIIDMSGPGARYTRYSALNNVVVTADPIEGVKPSAHEAAVRMAGLKAAHYLAKVTLGRKADHCVEFVLDTPEKELPSAAVMYMVMAQGLLHDNYIYGVDAKRLHPTLLHPNEIFDGAVVNGCCVVAGDKSTTYDHQNNALLEEFYMRHGSELNFKGAILVPVYPGLADKERCCSAAVNMARLLELDGVAIPEEGGGNPEADLMMICRECEKNGIRTVMMLGPDGAEEPVADTTPEADAVINVGDCNEFVILPRMERVLGQQEQVKYLSGGADTSILQDGSIRVSLSAIQGSVIGQGALKMSSQVY